MSEWTVSSSLFTRSRPQRRTWLTRRCCPSCCTGRRPGSGETRPIEASARRSAPRRHARKTSPIGATVTGAWSMRSSGRRIGPSPECAPRVSIRSGCSSACLALPRCATAASPKTRTDCSSPARSRICIWFVTDCCGFRRRSASRKRKSARSRANRAAKPARFAQIALIRHRFRIVANICDYLFRRSLVVLRENVQGISERVEALEGNQHAPVLTEDATLEDDPYVKWCRDNIGKIEEEVKRVGPCYLAIDIQSNEIVIAEPKQDLFIEKFEKLDESR